MDYLSKLLEKVLMSVLFSVGISIVGFSMMTGHFPPRKDELMQAYRLGKQMLGQSKEFNQANQAMAAEQAAGGAPTLEQMAKLQELGLKRTQTTIELMAIFKKFPQGVPNQALADKLNSIQAHMDSVDKELGEAQEAIKATAQPADEAAGLSN